MKNLSRRRPFNALLGMTLLSFGCVEAPKAVTSGVCPRDTFRLPNVEIREGTAKKELHFGDQTLRAELCRFDVLAPELVGLWANETLRAQHMAPDGALLVVTNDDSVHRYIVEPGEECRLRFDRQFGNQGILHFPKEDVDISVLETGSILASGSHYAIRYKDGVYSRARCDNVNMVVGRAVAGFLVGYSEIQRVDIEKGCETKDWPLQGWGEPEKRSLFFAHPWGNDIVVGGFADHAYRVAIHDLNGQQKIAFGKSLDDPAARPEEKICWPRDADPCRAGACVLDSNCRRLSAWNLQNGSFVGAIALEDLLGLENPWPVDLVMGKSEAFLAVTHQKKAESARSEMQTPEHVGLIFRIRGLN